MNSIVLALAAICLIAGISAIPVSAPGQNYYNCDLQKGDNLLYTSSVYRKKVATKVITSTVTYPESGVSTAVIHCIRAIDNMSKEGQDGGTASIVAGGINQTYVELLLTSKKSRGLDFTVQIFGH